MKQRSRGFKSELSRLAWCSSKSRQIVDERQTIMRQFVAFLRENNIQIATVKQIKVRYIESYIAARLSKNIDKYLLQNEMSAIRAVLIEAGCSRLANHERLSHQSLGIGGE